MLPVYWSKITDLLVQGGDLFAKTNLFGASGSRFQPAGLGKFEILFDLGISGISTFSTKAQTWVVRCSARNFRPKGVPVQAWLILTKGAYDETVRSHAREVCESLTDDFLLKYETAEEFYQWVRENALQLLNDPRADTDFRTMRLQPFNVVGPLELAGVYAAFLGKNADAEMLRQAAIEFAAAHGMEYAIMRVSGSISTAGFKRN
jgi:hypothetical protein